MGVLRLLLALSVLLAHSDHTLGLLGFHPTVAVRSFYIISGFYMALVLNTKYLGLPKYVFWRSRYLRLFPAYLVTLALTCLYGYVTYRVRGTVEWPFQFWQRGVQDLEPGSIVMLALSNVFILGQDLLYYFQAGPSGELLPVLPDLSPTTNVGDYMLIPQAWTLGVELLFYAAAPFLARRRVWFLLGLMLASMGSRYLLPGFGLPLDAFGYRFFPFELAYFVMGILAYKAYGLLMARGPSSPLCAGLAALGLAAYAWVQAAPPVWMCYPLLAASIPFLFQLTRNSRLDRLTGELSYPVYITHMLVLTGLRQFTSWGTDLPGLVITLALSGLLYFLVDRPLDHWREALARTGVRALPGARALAVTALGVCLALAPPFWVRHAREARHLEGSIPFESVDLLRSQPEKLAALGLEPTDSDSTASWRLGLGPRTELLFSLPKNANFVLTMEFQQLMPRQTVTVSFNDVVLEALECEGRCSVYRQYVLPGSREKNALRIDYADWNGLAAQIIPNETRPLAVSFTRLSLDFHDPREGGPPARKN
ncbi:MAG: acyltransferase family protein [Acidobacteriota bacterium]